MFLDIRLESKPAVKCHNKYMVYPNSDGSPVLLSREKLDRILTLGPVERVSNLIYRNVEYVTGNFCLDFTQTMFLFAKQMSDHGKLSDHKISDYLFKLHERFITIDDISKAYKQYTDFWPGVSHGVNRLNFFKEFNKVFGEHFNVSS